MLFMVALLSAVFFRFELYSKKVPMAGYIQTNMWVTGLSDLARQKHIADKVLNSDLCTKPRDYDYQWDPLGVWTYTNHSCLPLCEAGVAECMNPMDNYIPLSDSSGMFVTQIMETTLIAGVDPGSAAKFRNYFVPTVEALGVGFTYSYDVPEEVVSSNNLVNVGGSSTLAGSSTEDVLTVLLDQEGSPWRTLRPSPSIDLTVPELLWLAGDEGLLDSFAHYAGPNQLQGAEHSQGPLARIAGVSLSLEVSCHNSHQIDVPDDWDGAVCYVAVSHDKRRGWTSTQRRDSFEGGERQWVYHGILIKSSTGGSLDFFDLNNIFLNIVSYLVLLSLPKKALRVLVVRLLGPFSRIYKGVLYEKFNIMEQVGGMATRLMGNSSTFVDLQDCGDDASGTGGGISKRRMGERLKEAVRHRSSILDDGEVEQLVNFCFNAISNSSIYQGIRPSKSFFMQVIGKGREPEQKYREADAVINIDQFNIACSSTEPIGFEAIVELFDRDRSIRRLERFFMPPYMQEYMREVDRARSSTKIGDLEQGPMEQLETEWNPADLGMEKVQSDVGSVSGTESTACCSDPMPVSCINSELVSEFVASDVISSTCIKSGQSLTLEQRKHLTDSMRSMVQDLALREQATVQKVHDGRKRLESLEARMEKLQGLEGQLERQRGQLDKWLPDVLAGIEERLMIRVEAIGPEVRAEAHQAATVNGQREVDRLTKTCDALKTAVDSVGCQLEVHSATLSHCVEDLQKVKSEVKRLAQGAGVENSSAGPQANESLRPAPRILSLASACTSRGKAV